MNFRRFVAIFHKERRHILRDPLSLGMALAIPLLLLILFGYALTLDVDRIPTAVYDRDQTQQSRDLVNRFRGSKYFQIVEPKADYRFIDAGISRSSVLLGLVIERDFGKKLAAGQEARVQALLDGSDSNTASIAAGYVESLVMGYATDVRQQAMSRKGISKLEMPADARIRVMYNSDLKSKNFIVPGLIAVILMLIGAMLTSLCIAREWENGTMEQLLSTPVRPAELLFGKLCAYFVLGMTDMLVALVVAVGVFDVPMRGSVVLLVLSSGLFLFGALCWGIFLSTVLRSQLLAYQISLLTSFLPSFLLSGFIYSLGNMPWIIQQISRVVPARYFIVILQGIFLKGVGMSVLGAQFLFLFVYANGVLALAMKKLRPKLV